MTGIRTLSEETGERHLHETDERSMSSGKPGGCYGCGDKGHWSRDCTKKDYKANKISEILDSYLPISNLALFNDISNILPPFGF